MFGSNVDFPNHPAESDWIEIPGDRLRVIDTIALGSTSQVLLVERRRPGGFRRKLVLKRLLTSLKEKHPRFVNMLVEEGKMASSFNHPNLVTVEDLWVGHDSIGILMEHLDGASVSTLMREGKAKLRDLRFIVSLLYQYCCGVSYAHGHRDINGVRHNLVHGDLSPTNLFLTTQGQGKVLDFGLATSSFRRLALPGLNKGRLTYMSPEQIQHGRITDKTDQFSLAVVAYEMLLGQRLFKRPTRFLTMQAILNQEVPPLRQARPDVSPKLAKALDRALSREPKNRYPTIMAFGEALADGIEDCGGLYRPHDMQGHASSLINGDTTGETKVRKIAKGSNAPFAADFDSQENTSTKMFTITQPPTL